MSLPASEMRSVPALTVKVQSTSPEIEPPPAMEFDDLGPWLAEHPDLREIALKLIAEVTDEEEVAADASELAEDDDETEFSYDDADENVEVDPSDAPEAPGLVPAGTNVVARVDPGRRTLTLHRTLRSGASVRFEGDVVLFGDLNPGAQIVAAGNIVVLGHLKGLAHAGCMGDESSFILGFHLRPTQLRIARHIAIPPSRAVDAVLEPEIARFSGDEIAIEPYRARNRQAGA